MESGLQRELDGIRAVIANRQASRLKDEALVYALGHILYPPITAWYRRVRFSDMARSFYVTSECGGCGTCERVCLSGKVRLKDGKPEWYGAVECAYCFACLHFCPNQAIQLKNRKTTERGRYHHPEIQAWDITRQKEWGE
jgi:formate hydrogenlyase subunit 6/NADH:ubiquinone oxidoreductase subunit I